MAPEKDTADIPFGYCHCGCGQKTTIAKKTNKRTGTVAGRPLPFLPGHVQKLRLSNPDNIPEPNPSGLCMCGCGQPAPLAKQTCRERGWVVGKPKRFINNHAMRKRTYEIDPDTGCWNWTGTISHWGYGRLHADGKHWQAHRWMYEQARGPIPDGLYLDHLCRNKRCVNPDHLEPVTPAENVRRGNLAQITMETARAIRAMAKDHPHRVVASVFGVGKSIVHEISAGNTWNEERETNHG